MRRGEAPSARLGGIVIATLLATVVTWTSCSAGWSSSHDPAPRPADEPEFVPEGYSASTSPASGSLLGQRTLLILAGLGGAALASKSFEDPDRMARSLDGSPLEGLIDIGDQYGDGLTMGIGTAGLLLTGRLLDNRAMSAAGSDLARSLLLSGAAVWALKLTINARRPSGGPYSFPSGHTASAFAAAPVIARHWGWRAGAGALVLAAGTALGRMEDRRHYLADVLFGAAIGLAVGYEIAQGSAAVRGETDGRGGFGGLLRAVTVRPQGIGLSLRF